jgi:hypothetical protein
MGVVVAFGGAAFVRAIIIGHVTLHMHEVYLASDPVSFWAILGPYTVLWVALAFQVITGRGIPGDDDKRGD